MSRTARTTIDTADVARFSAQAADWWNPDGSFRPLHRLNPLRVAYVRDQICAHYKRDANSRASLKGLSLLDVGCGGGLLTEPLARLGGTVTGLDASAETIAIAQKHANAGRLVIDYRMGSVENLAATAKRFDVITALEIVEHVADVESFVAALSKLLKPNGLLIMSTLNRTPQSFLLGIVAAEYILGWVPRGTHSWKQFIRPSELTKQMEAVGISTTNLTGIGFNPITNEFEWRKKDLRVNYMLAGIKR